MAKKIYEIEVEVTRKYKAYVLAPNKYEGELGAKRAACEADLDELSAPVFDVNSAFALDNTAIAKHLSDSLSTSVFDCEAANCRNTFIRMSEAVAIIDEVVVNNPTPHVNQMPLAAKP